LSFTSKRIVDGFSREVKDEEERECKEIGVCREIGVGDREIGSVKQSYAAGYTWSTTIAFPLPSPSPIQL
jgi:hypothetical protein